VTVVADAGMIPEANQVALQATASRISPRSVSCAAVSSPIGAALFAKRQCRLLVGYRSALISPPIPSTYSASGRETAFSSSLRTSHPGARLNLRALRSASTTSS
jgi:hypothetical protein